MSPGNEILGFESPHSLKEALHLLQYVEAVNTQY